jgi:hypothetical protein
VAKDEEQQDKTEMELRQGFVAKTKGSTIIIDAAWLEMMWL